MVDNSKDQKRFSVIARLRSANHAWRGILIFFKSSHNAWGHLFFALLALYMGFMLNISETEWVLLILTVGLVFIAEAFNTAIEIDIDLTSPEYHPYARDTKDVAAGAVALTVFVACVVALIIFAPKIFSAWL